MTFLLACLLAQTEVIYLRYEVKGRTVTYALEREGPDGKSLGSVPLKAEEVPCKMRATADGTILAARADGLAEFQRDGKMVWQHKGTGFTDAQKLPGGNVIAVANSGSRNTVSEIDPEGKVLRKVDVTIKGGYPRVSSVRLLENGRILAAGGETIVEVGWDGKRHFEHTLAKGSYAYDAMELPGGDILYSAKGDVAQITRERKKVWSAYHGCPTSVQLLCSGNILVGGG